MEAVAQTPGELAGSVLRPGSENGQVCPHARPAALDAAPPSRSGTHFRERAAPFPRRLCATASRESAARSGLASQGAGGFCGTASVCRGHPWDAGGLPDEAPRKGAEVEQVLIFGPHVLTLPERPRPDPPRTAAASSPPGASARHAPLQLSRLA